VYIANGRRSMKDRRELYFYSSGTLYVFDRATICLLFMILRLNLINTSYSLMLGAYFKEVYVEYRIIRLNIHCKILVSLAQLVWTMHKICKVRGSNPDHHQKKYPLQNIHYGKLSICNVIFVLPSII
jgi:uncharacterized membrane protein